MWPFKAKKIETLQLPPLPPKFDDEDVSLFPEEIPEEIPPLDELNDGRIPGKALNPDVEEHAPELISQPIIVSKKQKGMPSSEKFMMMDTYKETLTQLVSTNEELRNIDFEFSKVMKLKEEKDNKIDALQASLEEVSKKMMFMENTLFGG